ncbi:hypothetical protein SC499_26120 [Peribacillus simplex]|uniref:hypothetical protein n=1 Tax=Peribacillus simplex TaxID=1478 RepID=UPI00298D881A|nr:hypothetical protein [Peribacillus simplex]MDW7618033.1 hypothetical protein [Peribacillus simplex]
MTVRKQGKKKAGINGGIWSGHQIYEYSSPNKMSSDDNKLIKIPITNAQRKINEYGNGYVPCEVSERWLQFSEDGSSNGLVKLNVMAIGANKPRKVCELVLTKENILRALENVDFK